MRFSSRAPRKAAPPHFSGTVLRLVPAATEEPSQELVLAQPGTALARQMASAPSDSVEIFAGQAPASAVPPKKAAPARADGIIGIWSNGRVYRAETGGKFRPLSLGLVRRSQNTAVAAAGAAGKVFEPLPDMQPMSPLLRKRASTTSFQISELNFRLSGVPSSLGRVCEAADDDTDGGYGGYDDDDSGPAHSAIVGTPSPRSSRVRSDPIVAGGGATYGWWQPSGSSLRRHHRGPLGSDSGASSPITPSTDSLFPYRQPKTDDRDFSTYLAYANYSANRPGSILSFFSSSNSSNNSHGRLSSSSDAPAPAPSRSARVSTISPDRAFPLDAAPLEHDASKRALFSILKNCKTVDDLHETSTVNRAFYSVFKQNERPLLSMVLYNECPAAWEFVNMISSDGDDRNGQQQVLPYALDEVHQQSRLDLGVYRHGQSVIGSLKELTLKRCRSFLRTSTALDLGRTGGCTAVDNAFWRIWTFCHLFGLRKEHSFDIGLQCNWLRGGRQGSELSMQTCLSMFFGLGNVHSSSQQFHTPGLGTAELYDMMEVWTCLAVLLESIDHAVPEGWTFGVFSSVDAAPASNDEAEAILEEFRYHLLTLGLPAVHSMASLPPSRLPVGFALAKSRGILPWTLPPAGLTYSLFLKQAVSEVYKTEVSQSLYISPSCSSPGFGSDEDEPLDSGASHAGDDTVHSFSPSLLRSSSVDSFVSRPVRSRPAAEDGDDPAEAELTSPTSLIFTNLDQLDVFPVPPGGGAGPSSSASSSPTSFFPPGIILSSRSSLLSDGAAAAEADGVLVPRSPSPPGHMLGVSQPPPIVVSPASPSVSVGRTATAPGTSSSELGDGLVVGRTVSTT